MEWMLDIQLRPRNLSPIQRIAIAEKYRHIYEKQAKENLKQAGSNYGAGQAKPLVNLPKVNNTASQNSTLLKNSNCNYFLIVISIYKVNSDVYVLGDKLYKGKWFSGLFPLYNNEYRV